ncbi:solute carrier family 39 (zinc transporter), member 9, partial [Tremellales sp. Uapishka_1]
MGAISLIAQCIAMFVASVLAGSLPLMFKSAMQGKRLKAISVLGMGLLVGAALTIIIPEGISTLYDSLPKERDEHVDQSAMHAIGLSLLSGFALMLMIESLTPHPPHSPPPSACSSPSSPDSSAPRPLPVHMDSHTPMLPKHLHISDPSSERRNKSSGLEGLNATLGLVIHGAADGIALGASSLSESGSLGVVVFLAVLVHKGPTALGLTTTLLSLRLEPPAIRKRLLIFSLAAPIGAMLTFFLVKAFGATGESGIGWWTGIALLFSGGSFLYVATVIQPLSSTNSSQHSHSHHSDVEDGPAVELGKIERTVLLVVGMLVPIGLGLLVGDHH